ncbi:MAG: DUF4244 domain-containing protein [Actinomycetaceae bacterium]|nr:DUF4244 domain-containing protein [Actinomycetaceae bacterium]
MDVLEKIALRAHIAWQNFATYPENTEDGMTTAEYAIGTVAAAGFAGLLVAILKSGAVKTLLLGIIKSALSV